MSAKIFVGNLHPRTTKGELVRFFSAAGKVSSVSIPLDRETGEPRGFGFVEFSDREGAEDAFELCDGRELEGRALRLSWAREGKSVGPHRRAKWRRDLDEPFDEPHREGRPGRGGSRDGWDGRDGGSERRPERRGGKHGSDRIHRRGTRREID